MKNKDGFISMTLVYTFLIVFMFIMLAIISSYTQKNHFLETINEKIDEDLKNYMGIDINILNKLLNNNAVISAKNVNLSSDTSTNGFYYLDKEDVGNDILDENADGSSNRIYFFRGSTANNYIVVNNLCFRIIRTNENGSIRMIYYNDSSTCEGDASPIAQSVYNENSSIGYMFEEDGTYQNSYVKNTIDNWFNINLSSMQDKISDAVYCNHKTKPASFTLKCDETDRFELHYFSGGNTDKANSLEYGIALPTYSDLILAGASGNAQSYLNYENEYWLMSADGSKILTYNGGFTSTDVTETKSVFPVISLKSNIDIIGGNGSQGNPYKIG